MAPLLPPSVNMKDHQTIVKTPVSSPPSAASTPKSQPKTKSQKSHQSLYQRLRFGGPITKSSSVTTESSSAPRDFVPESSATIEEFKSVQSLKQFWISAFGGAKSTHKKARSSAEATNTPPSPQAGRGWKSATLGSLSKTKIHSSERSTWFGKSVTLHRNFTATDGMIAGVEDPQPIRPTSIPNLAETNSETETFSLRSRGSVDNFYKYKNADLVKQRYSRQSSGGDISPSIASGAPNLMAVQTKWTKRTEPSATPETDTITDDVTMQIRHKFETTTAVTSTSDCVKNPSTNDDERDKIIMKPGAQSPPSTISQNNSSHSLAAISNSESASSTNTTRKSAGVSRKCSFRTNLYQSHGRKMASSVPGSGSSSSGGSKVAALTHRFNQLCEHDANRIRDQVVRNKEVILLRANGKVFKVVTEGDVAKKAPSTGRVSSDSSPVRVLKKRGSVKRKDRLPPSVSTKAKSDAIPTIGVDTNGMTSGKPQVPDKSVQVLLRKKEIFVRNITKKPSTTVVAAQDKNNHLDERTSHFASLTEDGEKLPMNKVLKKDPDEIDQSQPTQLKDQTEMIPLIESTQKTYDVLQGLEPTNSEDRRQLHLGQPTETIPTRESSVIPTIQETASTITTKKSKYVRLYEKFRFKPSFMSSAKKSNMRIPLVDNDNCDPELPPDDPASVQKIVDAISKASQRIELLSRSESCLLSKVNDNAAPNIQPNQSFLFRSDTAYSNVQNNVHSHVSAIVEAVNPCIRGKSRSMGELVFKDNTEETDEVMVEMANDPPTHHSEESVVQLEEDDYEIIAPPADADMSMVVKSQPHQDATTPVLLLETQDSFLYRSIEKRKHQNATHERKSEVDCSDIYQSIADVFSSRSTQRIVSADQSSVNSYESFENYECVDDELLEKIRNENGYEICEPPDPPPEPPPPRLSTSHMNAAPTLATSPQPPLPVPKRIFHNFDLTKSDSVSSNYELIKYDKIPPRPPPPKSASHPITEPDPARSVPMEERLSTATVDYDTGENIYDTITAVVAGSRPTIVNRSPAAYECVGVHQQPSFIRPKRLSHSDSASTISSDNKTNSIYGTALSRRESISVSPPSEPVSDNNSDDWIDISDGEAEASNHKLIVVCDRKRQPPRAGADWSQMVRDQRMHNKHQSEYYDDDSDHYYESLHPSDELGQLNGSTTTGASPAQLVNAEDSPGPYHMTDRPLPSSPPQPRPTGVRSDCAIADDEYDSFDSDEETDEDVRKNDSGVDVSNNRLPDPPTPTNQVYAFMQKIRNFGSLSKNLSKFSKKNKPLKTRESAKLYDATRTTSPLAPAVAESTQFYVNVGVKQSSADADTNKRPTAPRRPDEAEPYQNTEFHAPRRTASVPRIEVIIPSETATPVQPSTSHDGHASRPNATPSPTSKVFTRKKSKSGKSFKSKFRKSAGPEPTQNVGTSFNGTRSTFYISDSVDVDSGVFTNSGVITPTQQTVGSSDQVPIVAPISAALPTANTGRLSSTSTASTAHSPEVNQRKSSLTVRPNNPPPPPPSGDRKSVPVPSAQLSSTSKAAKRLLGTTSWYAECGVFKSDTLNSTGHPLDSGSATVNGGGSGSGSAFSATTSQRKDRAANTSSWYADVGLYQTSGASIASSSGSSGVSTGGSGDDHSHSMFFNEPLYQIYSAAKLESISNDIEMDAEDHSDGYEEVGTKRDAVDGEEEEERKRSQRPTALQLVGPKQGPSRTLWSEIPEVLNSEILSTLTTTERRLQEAKFEILTSEASYLKSLTLLRTHFMNHPAFRDTNTLSAADRKTLFSYMISVQECSDRLLCDLENCWQDNIMLLGLSHSVYKHAEKYFHVYVAYCEHQGKLDRTLKRLKESKSTSFYQNMCLLESDAACCGLSLHSFLMLPMQRITRLPLLVDAVVSKLKGDDDEYDSWKITLAILNKIVGQCNDAANRSAQTYELEILSRQIEFPQSIRPLAIVPVGACKLSHRSLVRRGELTHIVWRGDDGKLTFGKKFHRSPVYAFLFTDLLVLAKRRDNDTYSVVDYCERLLLTVTSGDVIPQLPTKDVTLAGKHLICMTLLENHEGKMTEMIFACASETDRQRWLLATEPPASENPDEKLYEQWDCPQVTAKHLYQALQPDELGLEAGDVVNVTRKMADGWYQGERLRDGAQGWFPGNYTEEVASAHVRARNLKQRYRLLTFTAAYWEAQKRK